MQYDAGDRKDVRRKEKAAALADRNRVEVVAGIVSSAGGRQYLWEQLERLNVFASTYSDDALRMAFSEGRRSAGLELLADWMRIAPDQFILAMREANGRSSSTDDDRSRPATNGAAGEPTGRAGPGWDAEGLPSDAAEGDTAGDEA